MFEDCFGRPRVTDGTFNQCQIQTRGCVSWIMFADPPQAGDCCFWIAGTCLENGQVTDSNGIRRVGPQRRLVLPHRSLTVACHLVHKAERCM